MSKNDDKPEPGEAEDHRLVAERRRKLDALREAGFAYPNHRRRTALAAQSGETFDEYSAEHLDEETRGVRIVDVNGHVAAGLVVALSGGRPKKSILKNSINHAGNVG